MLVCGKIFRFYLVVILLIWNFSCTDASLKGQNIVNVGKENSKEETTKVSDSPSKIREPWQVGTFRGLVMGKASIDDLQKVLGKPSVIADLEPVGNADEWAYHYENQDIKGKLVVYVNKKTKTVISVELRPNSMSKEEVLNYFGGNYIITRYSFDDCDNAGFDSAPIYEDPNGQREYIEYRDKGIAIALFQNNDKSDNTVQYILYLSEPPGNSFSRCYSNSEKK